MLRGVVTKAYSGYYYVQTDSKVTMCTLRGRFKKARFSLLVGDEVEYAIIATDKGVIENILPRRSALRRPMVANIDQVVVTFAAANPDFSTILLDRFLVLSELASLETVICINKIELANIDELQIMLEPYRHIGYTVILVSAKNGIGIGKLRDLLYGKVTVFAGPSGVGKSSLLNAVEPGLQLSTGEISSKIGRGRHTTRYAQLLSLTGGGFVVDTPGFSLTEFDDINEIQLISAFREFSGLSAHCKYNSCLHIKEPQCAVKEALANGLISQQRYESYLEMLDNIREKKKGL